MVSRWKAECWRMSSHPPADAALAARGRTVGSEIGPRVVAGEGRERPLTALEMRQEHVAGGDLGCRIDRGERLGELFTMTGDGPLNTDDVDGTRRRPTRRCPSGARTPPTRAAHERVGVPGAEVSGRIGTAGRRGRHLRFRSHVLDDDIVPVVPFLMTEHHEVFRHRRVLSGTLSAFPSAAACPGTALVKCT